MNTKCLFIFLLLLVVGCQTSSELSTPAVGADVAGDVSLSDVRSGNQLEVDTKVTPSLSIEGNCEDYLKPNSCEWANTSDNQLYLRITSVSVVKDDVVAIRHNAESNETEWINVGFEQCQRPRIALEITAEVLWSWLPISANEVSVIVGPSTLLAFGLYADWDTAEAEVAWYNGNVGLVPGMEFGAGVAQHPNKEDTFVMNWNPLFDQQSGKLTFYKQYEAGCMEIPTAFQGLTLNEFKQEVDKCVFVPDSTFRSSQTKGMTGPMLYTTSCNDSDLLPGGCTSNLECFSGYVCTDYQCVCHPDAPNCP
jgi:hypothetical protein